MIPSRLFTYFLVTELEGSCCGGTTSTRVGVTITDRIITKWASWGGGTARKYRALPDEVSERTG